MSSRSPHRPDIRVSQDTGQVTKLGAPKKSSSSSNLTLPPSFRSTTWNSNRTVTPYDTSSSSPSSSPSLSRSARNTPSPSLSTSGNNYNSSSNNFGGTSSNNGFNSLNTFNDPSSGMTRGTNRPSSAGTTLGATKTTEKEYIQNLQQQIQVLEMQSKYLQDRDSTRVDEDIDDSDLASIGKHMAVLRKKCIALEQSSKVRVDELEQEIEELHTKNGFTEHLLENANDEKGYLKREMERLKMEHQEDRDKLLDDVMNAQRTTEKHARTITGLEQNRDRLTAEKEKLRTQVASLEMEKSKLETARDAAVNAEKSSQKREEDLMTKVSDLQRQLDELKDVKRQITQIEQQSKDAIKQATDEKWASELKQKQLESSLDQVTQARAKLETDCKLYIEENNKLRANVDALQRDLRTEQTKLQTKNAEMVTKAESEVLAQQKSNQLFQKWKEATEKVASNQTRIDELTLQLAKAKQDIETHKEEERHLRNEAERQSAHYLQIEVESLSARKESLSLQAQVAKLKADMEQADSRKEAVDTENAELSANLDVLKKRAAMQKEIDKTLSAEELEQMKNSNLQMADTVAKLAQKLSTISGT